MNTPNGYEVLEKTWQRAALKLQTACENLQQADAPEQKRVLAQLALTQDVRWAKAVGGCLDNDDASVCRAAVDCLAALQAEDVLIERLQMQTQGVNITEWPGLDHWLGSLHSGKWLSYWPLREPLPNLPNLAAYLQPDQIELWIKRLSDADAGVHHNALLVVQEVLSDDFPESIYVLLQDTNPDVRRKACSKVLRSVSEQHLDLAIALPLLLPHFSDPVPEVRWQAMLYLPAWMQAHLDNLSPEKVVFFETRYQAKLRACLQDELPSLRLLALEEVIPPDLETARFALEEVIVQTGSTRVPDAVFKRMQCWPLAFKPVLKQLLSPVFPVADLSAWLELIGATESEWQGYLEEWLAAPVPAAQAAAIRFAQAKARRLDASWIALMLESPHREIRLALSHYLSGYLTQDPPLRHQLLSYLACDADSEVARHAANALWQGHPQDMAVWLLDYLPKLEAVPCTEACLYLIHEDAKQARLDHKTWLDLLAFPVMRQACERVIEAFSPLLADLLFQRWSLNSSSDYPWKTLFKSLSETHDVWQVPRFTDYLLEAPFPVQQTALDVLAERFSLLSPGEEWGSFIQALARAPFPIWRRTALRLLADLPSEPAPALVEEALQDGAALVQLEALKLVQRKSLKVWTPVLFSLLEHTHLRLRRQAADILSEWGVIGVGTDWSQAQLQNKAHYPRGLWLVLGLTEADHCSQTFLNSDRLEQLIFDA